MDTAISILDLSSVYIPWHLFLFFFFLFVSYDYTIRLASSMHSACKEMSVVGVWTAADIDHPYIDGAIEIEPDILYNIVSM